MVKVGKAEYDASEGVFVSGHYVGREVRPVSVCSELNAAERI
jgi:hypothetical protein